jgi:hypothetical protein
MLCQLSYPGRFVIWREPTAGGVVRLTRMNPIRVDAWPFDPYNVRP